MDKDKAILPICYFGPLEYYWVLHNYDSTVEVHENYQKRSVRNRAEILSANGRLTLSVPLKKGKTLAAIKAVEIAYNDAWQKQHLTAIVSAYRSAPYFDHYFPAIETIISTKWQTLYELNAAIMNLCTKKGWAPPFQYSSEYISTSDYYQLDMRPTKVKWLRAFAAYNQVFEDKYGYTNNLSILDGIFNLGPQLTAILKQ